MNQKRNLSVRHEASLWLKVISALSASIAISALGQIPARWLPQFLTGQAYYLGFIAFCLGALLVWRMLDRASIRKSLALSGLSIALLGLLLSSPTYRARFHYGIPRSSTRIAESARPPAPAPARSVGAPPILPPAAPPAASSHTALWLPLLICRPFPGRRPGRRLSILYPQHSCVAAKPSGMRPRL